MVNLFINGEPKTVASTDVTGLMAELNLDPRTVLVEHNGKALHRNEWPQVQLVANDRIEILRVVAGG